MFNIAQGAEFVPISLTLKRKLGNRYCHSLLLILHGSSLCGIRLDLSENEGDTIVRCAALETRLLKCLMAFGDATKWGANGIDLVNTVLSIEFILVHFRPMTCVPKISNFGC